MTPYYSDEWLTIYQGDCRDVLPTLPADSVDCVVTSPPYFGLRDYGTARWEGGDPECDHQPPKKQGATGQRSDRTFTAVIPFREQCGKCSATRVDSQLGLERTPQEYVANMVAVFREVRRVLKPSGTCWLNLGDSYAANRSYQVDSTKGGAKHSPAQGFDGSSMRVPDGLKPKDLVGIPWRVAFALQADGWVLRSDVIWAKKNGMPESVRDRPTRAHEMIFLLTKARWTGIENPLRLSREDATWLAAMIDGEGTICINRKASGDGLVNPTYHAHLSCYNTHKGVIDRIVALTGIGKATLKPEAHTTNRPVWQWQVGGKGCVRILDAIEPFLMIKQRQAWLALELQSGNRHRGSKPGWGAGSKPKTADVIAREEAIYRGCSELNKIGDSDVTKRSWHTPSRPRVDQDERQERFRWEMSAA